MTIEFDEATHSYTLNGQPAPSVTQVLDAEGLCDTSFYRKEHRARGTWVHQICALLAEAVPAATAQELVEKSRWDPETTREDLVPYGKACAKFLADSRIKVERVEAVVGSEVWRVCGTADLVGVNGQGRRLVVDYKSGQPQPVAMVQAAMYALCAEECFGERIDDLMVVWLKPDGTYRVFSEPFHGSQAAQVAQCALNLYHWRKANRLI